MKGKQDVARRHLIEILYNYHFTVQLPILWNSLEVSHIFICFAIELDLYPRPATLSRPWCGSQAYVEKSRSITSFPSSFLLARIPSKKIEMITVR